MKILFFLTALKEGGAERVTSELASRLAADGHEAVIVTFVGPDPGDYPLDARVRHLRLGMLDESGSLVRALRANLARVRALRRVVRAEAPTLVVSFLTACNVTALLATAGLGVPTIVSERQYPPDADAGRQWKALRGPVYGRAASVVVQADRGADWIRTHTRARRVDVVPNAVRWPLAREPGAVDPADVVPTGAKLLLAVGRLVPYKRFDLLIERFGRLAATRPDWHLCIVGSWDPGDLQRHIDALALADRVTLVGRVGNVGDWYSAASLYALSSEVEGFPNSLAEAMASGTAVVSFDCPTGPGELIRHELDGLLVPAADADALEATLARAMDDAALRARLAAAAPEVLERYSVERVTGLWHALFVSLARA